MLRGRPLNKRRVCFAAVVVSVAMCARIAPASGAERDSSRVDFNRDVRPILSKNCFGCHGQDHRIGKFRLDRRESAIRKRGNGAAAIVPGRPGESEFVARISATDEAERMPPPESGNRLTPAQIALFKNWIQQGAPYAEHWAFVKPKRPALPS